MSSGPHNCDGEFGTALTDHMVTARWSIDTGWSPLTLSARGVLALDAAAVGLHYGQCVFEGLKAYRQNGGGIALFRPEAYGRRMRNSAARLALPEPPEDLFLEALSVLIRADGNALPADPSLGLYLRPILIGSEPTLALRPARECLFFVSAFITGAFFSGRTDPISVWVSEDYVRTAPGGAGAAKWPGNYAPTFLAQREAERRGCRQVVWLDAVRREMVEELGGMNLFFVRDRGGRISVTTPPLTGTVLPGVTRDSIMTLGAGLGYDMSEEPVSLTEWRDESRSGAVSETIACGTAAIVTPVGRVCRRVDEWTIGSGQEGPVAAKLRHTITDLQRGRIPDVHGWLRPVA